jgi:hypothetical protein
MIYYINCSNSFFYICERIQPLIHLLKKVLGIFLIVVMTAQFAYQIGFIAYFNLNQKQLTEKFCVNKDKANSCCQAKCYLSKKLMTDEQNPSSEKAIHENDFPVFILPANYVFLFSSVLKLKHCTLYNVCFTNGFVNNGKKPPKPFWV